MTDIVETLHKYADIAEAGKKPHWARAYWDAIDEIERLRGLLRRWADHLSNDWEIELASNAGDRLLRETLEALGDVPES